MHIGFITPEYPHSKLTKVGGLGTSLKNLSLSLINQDVKVTVFVVNQSFQNVFKDEEIEIHAIKAKKTKYAQWFFSRRYFNKYINHIVDKESIDVLEAPDWTGITAFMKFKCPLVIRLHGSDAYFCHLDNRRQKFKNYLIEKLAIKGADAYIAPTKFAGNITKKLFNIRNKTIIVIHNGLFLEKFKNLRPNEYNQGEILYFGTLVRKKGVLELVKIFNEVVKLVPNASLKLIGNDSFDQKTNSNSTWQLMKNQFTKTALSQVEYLGKVPYEEINLHINSSNVCVFPTLAETLGMVTIESMALYKSVVNSNYGWALELIDDEVNGFLVDPKNTRKYVDRIVEIITNKSLAKLIGVEARKKVESTFDINKLVKTNINFYNTVINK